MRSEAFAVENSILQQKHISILRNNQLYCRIDEFDHQCLPNCRFVLDSAITCALKPSRDYFYFYYKRCLNSLSHQIENQSSDLDINFIAMNFWFLLLWCSAIVAGAARQHHHTKRGVVMTKCQRLRYKLMLQLRHNQRLARKIYKLKLDC